jgi:hypothetical protein
MPGNIARRWYNVMTMPTIVEMERIMSETSSPSYRRAFRRRPRSLLISMTHDSLLARLHVARRSLLPDAVNLISRR